MKNEQSNSGDRDINFWYTERDGALCILFRGRRERRTPGVLPDRRRTGKGGKGRAGGRDDHQPEPDLQFPGHAGL